jgi:hypothetical protein
MVTMMPRLLNTRTNTVHHSPDETQSETTACGSLAHVSQAQVRVVSEDEHRLDDGVARCGNCFEDAGGY